MKTCYVRRACAVASIIAIMTTSACASLRHVEIPEPPPASSSDEVRAEYYEQYRPHSLARSPAVKTNSAVSLPSADPFIQLRDGRRIVNVEDVLPAVGSSSVSGKAATRAKEIDGVADAVFGAGVATSAAGLGVAAAGTLMLYSSFATVDEEVWVRNTTLGFPISIAGLAITLIGVAALVPTEWWKQEAALERTTAMVTYEDSLRARLGLSTSTVAASTPASETE